MHVAKIDYAEFFASAFSDSEEARRFIQHVEEISTEQSKASVVLHQAARMVWLGDRIAEVARDRPALQVLFHIVAAEAVAKIVDGFTGEGKSRYYVRSFFENTCSEKHRAILARSFARVRKGSLTVREAVDLLYGIRCDVVHEGRYFNFSLPGKDDYPEITCASSETVQAFVTIDELRQIVVEGAVLAARRLLPKGAPESST